MSVKIKLFDQTEYIVSYKEADLINQAIAGGEKYIMLETSTFAISAIDHMDDMMPKKPEPALPARTKPKTGFEMPNDFYSEEATALRRQENRLKYTPGNQTRERFGIKAEVNRGDN